MTYNITFTKDNKPFKRFTQTQADINKRIKSALVNGFKVVQINNSLIIDYQTTQAIITKSTENEKDYTMHLLELITIILSVLLVFSMIKVVLFGY